jgi:hypothetical protein
MIGVAVFLLAGLLSINSLWGVFLPAGLYLLIHLVEGQTVTPMLLARRFTINPVAGRPGRRRLQPSMRVDHADAPPGMISVVAAVLPSRFAMRVLLPAYFQGRAPRDAV